MQLSRRNVTLALYLAIVLALLAIFASDVLTPLGYAVWIFYMVPAGACLFSRERPMPIVVAALSTVLLALGGLLSPSGINPTMSVFNRSVGGLTIWIIALVTFQYVGSRARLARLAWLQAAQMQVAAAIRGERTGPAVAAAVLRALAGALDARVGVLYTADSGRLKRLSAWALPQGESDVGRDDLAYGDGLLGQVASDGEPVIIRAVPAGYLKFGSGLGDSEPSQLLIAPITADGAVTGVLELGFVGAAPLDDAQELLRRAGESIGMAIRSSLYRGRLEELLARTQRQSEELQVQQEELRVSNEELEERGRALMDSQARLETQQSELEQSNVRLEEHTERLERQKHDLLEAQRIQARNAQALERANRYKSEFLANMSHELRTPLNSSLILAKLLQDNKNGNLSVEQVRYASTIYSSNTDLLTLINDILDLSKVEAGHLELAHEAIPLEGVLGGLAGVFEPIAADRGIGLRIEQAPAAPPMLHTDGQRLAQVLRNLMSNAFKFTEQGEVILRAAPADGGMIRFDVQDSGIGIEPENHAAIFEAFRQADGTTSRRYGGSGLGLSISRELAHLLGGEITVASQPGKGSTFTLTLPVGTVEGAAAADKLSGAASQASAGGGRPAAVLPENAAHATATAATPTRLARSAQGERAAAPDTSPGPGAAAGHLVPAAGRSPSRPGAPAFDDDRFTRARGTRLILVIEDDPAFARILYDLAHELDFDCAHAANAADGLRLAHELRPAGVLLDISLPDDSGLTVLDRLKHDPVTRHIPVHIVSVSDHADAALQLGAIGYTLKPTERQNIAEAIRALEARLAQRLRRILVVEDDPTLRENIKLLLQNDQLDISGAGTVAEALEHLSKTSFDCMVMDLALPDGSGYDLLTAMTQRGRHAFPPVIVYTGRNLTADEEQRLRYYSKSIIIKGARSPERLLDEVTLFLHSVESELPPAQQRMLREARQRDSVFEGRAILLAEDDVRNIFALSHVIEPLGARLEIARNGREALDMLAKHNDIELVLMDVMMPEMDGLTAMQEIRKRPELASLPIIALTAKAMSADRQRCLDAGANDYISKPIEVEKLLSLCRVWLSR